jgi:hypothetical protein
MGHQSALYFVPNLAQTRIEFLSLFSLFHGCQITTGTHRVDSSP